MVHLGLIEGGFIIAPSPLPLCSTATQIQTGNVVSKLAYRDHNLFPYGKYVSKLLFHCLNVSECQLYQHFSFRPLGYSKVMTKKPKAVSLGVFACSARNLLNYSRARLKSAIQKSIFHFRSRSAIRSMRNKFRDRK